jgi:hypothetical protein
LETAVANLAYADGWQLWMRIAEALWRAYATGADKDVLIGPNFKPFYDKDRGADLGLKSWQSEQWKIGGGAGWSWISLGIFDRDEVPFAVSDPFSRRDSGYADDSDR